MKVAVSGTYSSGKTSTVMALSHYTGIPRSLARTVREIMPQALPGVRLTDVTPAQFLQLTLRRHTGRAVQEALLGDDFVSDGSSLQEWLYGEGRRRYGMNPNTTAGGAPPVDSPEMVFFGEVVEQYGQAFRQHVKATYDAYVHLRHELPLAPDGHRPMNDAFRASVDRMLLATLEELRIPCHVVGGPMADRLETITGIFGWTPVMSTAEAIELARREYGRQDFRMEHERAPAHP
ncbi:AAA family ATPase [Streptomyces sp. MBT65]|uniref:AAA family ATPase n=1 Tax=Streptomyces sp. MBT65 TaxID=1488395 RepID=UPI00190D4860|nr:AAA family ATPase [Streptomyces sp. MBT65]MBK3581552.1 AAA family ATPase [Streptomyces sp. MBT65]